MFDITINIVSVGYLFNLNIASNVLILVLSSWAVSWLNYEMNILTPPSFCFLFFFFLIHHLKQMQLRQVWFPLDKFTYHVELSLQKGWVHKRLWCWLRCLPPSYTGRSKTVQAQRTDGIFDPWVMTSSGCSLSVSWALKDDPIHRAKTSSHKDSLWRDGPWVRPLPTSPVPAGTSYQKLVT